MKRLFLILSLAVSLFLIGCVTASSNATYASKLETRRQVLAEEYERQLVLEAAIKKMEEENEERSRPITGSSTGDVLVGAGISALISWIFGN